MVSPPCGKTRTRWRRCGVIALSFVTKREKGLMLLIRQSGVRGLDNTQRGLATLRFSFEMRGRSIEVGQVGRVSLSDAVHSTALFAVQKEFRTMKKHAHLQLFRMQRYSGSRDPALSRMAGNSSEASTEGRTEGCTLSSCCRMTVHINAL